MSEDPKSAARTIDVALTDLIRRAEEGNLAMLAYLLDMARIEARAQAGKQIERPSVVLPLRRQ